MDFMRERSGLSMSTGLRDWMTRQATVSWALRLFENIF